MTEHGKLSGRGQGGAEMQAGQTGIADGGGIPPGCGDKQCFVQENPLLVGTFGCGTLKSAEKSITMI
jgi:hypothetical protein